MFVQDISVATSGKNKLVTQTLKIICRSNFLDKLICIFSIIYERCEKTSDPKGNKSESTKHIFCHLKTEISLLSIKLQLQRASARDLLSAEKSQFRLWAYSVSLSCQRPGLLIIIECLLSALIPLICWILKKRTSETLKKEKIKFNEHSLLTTVKFTREILHVGEREG